MYMYRENMIEIHAKSVHKSFKRAKMGREAGRVGGWDGPGRVISGVESMEKPGRVM
jgi:hypothetical protein